MTTTETIPPVRRAVTVRCPVEHAFRTFTDGIASWWPLDTHAVDSGRARSAVFEPGIGGRIFERWDDGSEHHWGVVTIWEPPRRVVFDWHPNPNRPAPTEVEIRFVARGEETVVELEHRGWHRLGTEGGSVRESYATGWIGVLDRYATAAGAG
jgi:uncharacterized protein YndB with AHSA1/START domain